MSIIYGNANYRKKFDAFRIVDASGHEPLKQAIDCVLKMRESAEMLERAIEAGVSDEDRGKMALALAKCLPDEFKAWIEIATFIYSKPRHVTVDGTVTLESLLAGSWDKPIVGIQDSIESGNA